jgi:hypothetical protein
LSWDILVKFACCVRFVFTTVVCRGGSCLIYVVCVTVYSGVLHDFTIWETWRVYYKWKELFNHREPMGSPWSLLGSVLFIVLDFFVLLCFVCLEKTHTQHTIGTVQKSNRKIVVICKLHSPNINILPLLFF